MCYDVGRIGSGTSRATASCSSLKGMRQSKVTGLISVRVNKGPMHFYQHVKRREACSELHVLQMQKRWLRPLQALEDHQHLLDSTSCLLAGCLPLCQKQAGESKRKWSTLLEADAFVNLHVLECEMSPQPCRRTKIMRILSVLIHVYLYLPYAEHK